MNMIRVSHHDLPNPAKRIAELEDELLRVRAALEDQHASTDALRNEGTRLRNELARTRAELDATNALYQFGVQQHEAQEKIIGELEAERDALRARLQAVEAAARWACESWPARSENWIRADHEDAMEALTAALAGSEMTK